VHAILAGPTLNSESRHPVLVTQIGTIVSGNVAPGIFAVPAYGIELGFRSPFEEQRTSARDDESICIGFMTYRSAKPRPKNRLMPLTAIDKTMRIIPSAKAKLRSPLLVSSAIAVVMVRV
jgi:hypothetical protein